ncbi:MAG: protein kinase [Myxococcales bacterium]|nr:MAG: protein kinase [Myxococcales bacterium]
MEAQTFGPYALERRLDSGGMAEVFIARRTGPHGFVKRIALKRILPQYARNPEFIKMFVSEARWAAQLEHPNIVQVFDFGEQDGELFLAMELVDGTNVNKLLRITNTQHAAIPVDIILHIVHQSAQALAYAHRACDEAGKPLGIVHRDVSPANLLITRSGHVKLSDFGIVRAAGESTEAEPKQLRGKLGYMSPEQVLGSPLDSKSDVFTLCTVFAELLIAEPLFGVGSDLEILLRIRDADLRVLERSHRKIPSDVMDLLLQGLARRAKERIDSNFLVRELSHLLRRRGAANGPTRLAKYIVQVGLVGATGDFPTIDEAPSRPTELVPLGGYDNDDEDTARMMRQLDAISPAIYELKLQDGHEMGPVSFPKLVELITSGIVDSMTLVAKQGTGFRKAREFTEISRFVTSPAFRWDAEELANATKWGELGEGVLLSVVYQLLSKRETGVLHLRDEQRRKKIYFVDGRADFVVSTDKTELLGEYLITNKLCLRMEIEMALALLPRFGGRLGDALVGLNILRPVQLVRAVTDQVRSRFLEAFRWQAGQWAFVVGARSEEEAFPLGTDPHELLRDALFQVPATQIHSTLATGEFSGKMLLDLGALTASPFDLPDVWISVFRDFQEAAIATEVMQRHGPNTGLDEETIKRVVFFGASCGFLHPQAATPSSAK